MSQNSPPEPVTIIVSMALTALSVTLMGKYQGTWTTILLTFLFFFAGQATVSLYWSVVLDLVQDYFDYSTSLFARKKIPLLAKIIRFYLRMQLNILLLRCTRKEVKLFGCLSSFTAFLVFYIGILIKLLHTVFQKVTLNFSY